MDILLVDENDNVIGKENKLEAHKKGLLHRAFSIFIFNDRNELLVQKRAASKYHSGGKWTNTCCSHPFSEDIVEEAKKRLKEEMGFSTEIKEVFSFIYKAEVGELIEHEYDHVFFGRYNKMPVPDPNEVEDWRWISLENLKKDTTENPNDYTPWLLLSLNRVIEQVHKS